MIEEIKKSLNVSILISLLFLVLGIIFIIMPSSSLNVISNVIGVILIIYGLFEVLDCFRNNILFSTVEMIMGVLAISLGIIVLFNTDILDIVIPFVLGIVFISTGLSKVRLSMILYQVKSSWILSLVTSITSIVCGFIMILKPFSTMLLLTIFIGVITIIYSISSLVNTILLKYKIKEIDKYLEQVFR